MSGSFHPGELQAQRLAGVSGSAQGIRSFMPEQHRSFFSLLPFVLVASRAPDGQPQADVLHGAPGFASSPDPHTLVIAGASALQAGAAVGLLGIDLATRRRNRANGRVRSNRDGQLVIEVRESFGNCPRHIRPRQYRQAAPAAGPLQRFDGLAPQARALVAGADTFFVATSGGGHGLDISHRGGPPGFVGIDGDTLLVPDYDGNRYFNTLGNVLLDARAALLLIDPDSGTVLQLEGHIAIDWQGAGQRQWRFTVRGGQVRPGALPLRWDLIAPPA